MSGAGRTTSRRWFFRRVDESVLLQELPQMFPIHLRGPGRLRDVPLVGVEKTPKVGPLERVDHFPLGFPERKVRTHGERVSASGAIEDQRECFCGSDLRMERHRAVDHVSQLPNVSRPVVGSEGRHGPGVKGRAGEAPVAEKCQGDGLDVLAPIPKRRKAETQYGKPVVEVGAKAALGDSRGEIAPAPGDDADVDLHLSVASHRANRPLFDRPEEPRLNVAMDRIEFVEKQRALVRPEKCAGPVAHRPAKRALSMTKELAFQEARGKGGTVEGHERALSPRPLLVEGAGGELFADSGLAFEEHGDVGGGCELEHREDLAERQTVADEVAEASGRAWRDVEGSGLRLNSKVAVADLQRRPERHGGSLDPASFVERAVGAVEVPDLEVGPLSTDRKVALGHPRIGEPEVRVGVGSHRELALADANAPARIGAIDDHELTAPFSADRKCIAMAGCNRAHSLEW